jgi:hypothetical protein
MNTTRLTCNRRRLRLAGATGLASALALAACASLIGPRTIEVPKEELLSKLGQRFPVTQRVMNLLDISVSAPSLDLLPDTNRVAASIPLVAHEMLGGRDHPGRIKLSFGLRYEPQDLSVRLTGVKIEQVDIEGLPALFQQGLTRLGAAVAEERLQDQAVHHFKPDDLRSADRMGYEVGEIRVTATGLAIKLTPRP